ncbi:MAG: urea carboxylase-associated family protein [Betaproteobacteria bacterium]|nr:urea carboxylase-associated family protein [Betaproteobacteria bacterium]
MQKVSNSAPAGPVLWEEIVPGGAHWSGVMRRGTALRFTDLEGGANVAALFWNFEEKNERYNMPDTLKAQRTAFLTRGHCGFSDMGRVLFSIVEDTAGWHDTVCGVMDDVLMNQHFGTKRFQEHRNAMQRSGKEGLLKEMGRWGLEKRDLHANVNLFSKVIADIEGNLVFVAGKPAGTFTDLRFDMDVLLAISTCPHPLDPNSAYEPKPVRLSAWRAGIAPADDYCRNFRGENQRAFENTARYFAD